MLIGGLSACAGPRAFTRGTYEDPEQIAMLNDRWNQNDMQLVAKKIIESLQAWKQRDALDKPVVILETPRNRTTEHIDLQASIKEGKGTLNEAENVAHSTMTAILSRTTCYTGREQTWDGLMNSKEHWGPDKFVGSGGNNDYSRYTFDGSFAIPPVPQVGKPM